MSTPPALRAGATAPAVAARSPRGERLAAAAPALDAAAYSLLGSPPQSPEPRAGTGVLVATPAPAAGAAGASPLRRRALQAALTAMCVCGYGASLYVNGLAGRALSPAAGLVLLGAVRGLFQVALCAVMIATRTAPPAYLPGGSGAALSWRMLVPAAVGVWANAGFMPYAALVEGGEVSVLAPMCAMYSLVPIIFGLAVMLESRGARKLVGIALSLTSVLLLAFSGTGFAGSSPPPRVVAEKAALFLLTIASWGGGDCAAAYMGRSLSTFEIAASNSAGQFATAAIFGLVAICTGTFAGGSGGSGSGGVGALSFIASSVIANIFGIIAWLSFTRLGETEGASDFTPVVALYVYVPVLLSGLLLGENPFETPAKVAGLVCAGVAAVLLSLK
jgi:drug/metabolite transporter (DMT)-like permease